MHCYIRELPKCKCGKTATVEIFGSQNQSYGKFCKGCGNRKKKELEKQA